MNKTVKIVLKIIIVVLILGIFAFIWGNSMLNGDDSAYISDKIARILSPAIIKITHMTFDEVIMGDIVRKMAHFAEFFVLAMGLTIFIKKNISLIMFIGLFTAVTDEFIQSRTYRTSKIDDVVLDFCGFLCGMILTLIFKMALKGFSNALKRRKNKREKQRRKFNSMLIDENQEKIIKEDDNTKNNIEGRGRL